MTSLPLQATVKPWLSRKVPQSPDVVDLTQSGFPLIGGRVDVIAGDPIATVVDGHGQHVVSLITFTKRMKLPATSTIAGFHVRSWPEAGSPMLLSDIPESELATFRIIFRTPPPKQGAAAWANRAWGRHARGLA